MPVNGQQLYEEAVVLHQNGKAKEAFDLYYAGHAGRI